MSAFAKCKVKHGSLSEIIFVGTLNQGNMCWRYNLAIPSPVIVIQHGRNAVAWEHPWSTMVSIASWPLDCGSWVMRSITTVLKGHSVRSPGMRYKGVLFFVVHILFCWHIMHPLMYCLIHAFIFGHQYCLLLGWLCYLFLGALQWVSHDIEREHCILAVGWKALPIYCPWCTLQGVSWLSEYHTILPFLFTLFLMLWALGVGWHWGLWWLSWQHVRCCMDLARDMLKDEVKVL